MTKIPETLRDDLLRYLFATSAERARVIGDLHRRGSGLVELLVLLEDDDDARALLEVELLLRPQPGAH